MLFEGKIRVKAPIQKLWDTLMEVETLRECIPGAEKIEQLDERTYDCVIKQKVGPISVRFKFRNELVNMNPPTHVEMQGKGEDIGKAGHVTQRTTIDLKEVEGGEVEIAYHSNVTIVGKLAMFGDRIMKAKAKKVEADFTNALQEKLRSLE
jgi:carbon monoxide dehydrogenase subunit G